MRKFLLLSCLFFESFLLVANVSVGEWRTHFCYSASNQVVNGNGKVYVLASNKLFSYKTANDEIETYSTLNGLNGHNLACIAWCEAEKTLIIVYSDGNIDFLTPKGIVNLADFKNKSMTADKTIHGIRVYGSKAYLSTGIGLMVLDVAKREIYETYYIGKTTDYTSVKDAAIVNDTLVVLSDNGIYQGDTKSNLLDASSWSSFPTTPFGKPIQIVCFNNNILVLSDNGAIYRKEKSGWSLYYLDTSNFRMQVQNDRLLVCSYETVYQFDATNQASITRVTQVQDVSLDVDNNTMYLARGPIGLTKMSKTDAGYQISKDSIKANGPASKVAWKTLFKDETFFAAAGGQAKNWGDRAFTNGELLTFKNDQWSTLVKREDVVNQTKLPFRDVLNLSFDPNDASHFFATSWGEGLYEFRDSKFHMLYSNKNSTLQSSVPTDSSNYIRIDGSTFDPDANLWVLNSNSDKPIHVLLKKDNYTKWVNLDLPEMPKSPNWNTIIFTQKNQVWINSLRERSGIFVVDRYKLDELGAAKSKWITSMTDQDGNTLSPYYLNCITEDLNGAIWIGTNYGPIVANNPGFVFDTDYNFTRIKIPRNDGTDNADYLLNNIRITCIAVDGANRKWIGTNGSGIYLVSADGMETIHHFDMDNSPLPSNFIWSVSVDPNSGEAFISTDQGLVSYRGDATQSAINYEKIHVFPNPVTSGYEGQITVTGLMNNSQVSISNLAGNVMTKGISKGGQFTWDGITAKGTRAASGVYIVYCASEDGTQYQTCKFMIVH